MFIRSMAAVICVLTLSSGCGAANPGEPTGGAEPGAAAEQNAAIDRTIAVYAAVARALAETPGSGPLFVLDGAVESAAEPGIVEAAPEPFDAEVKAGLVAALSSLGSVEFVSTRGSVITGASASSPGEVMRRGALLTLGPIHGAGTKVKVGANLWRNGLAGQWQTSVVEEKNGVWKVTGTTGPVSMS